VKRLGAIIFACAIATAIFAADAPLSSPVTSNPPVVTAVSSPAAAQTQPDAQPAAEEEALPSSAPPALFHIGPLPISNSVVCTWIVAAIILVTVRLTTWKSIKEVPSGMQNLMEALVEGWENFMGDVLDPKVTRWVFPFATTFFIFILLSDYVDLIPGVGTIGFGTPAQHSLMPFAIENVHRPFFRPPTTDANLTVAMTAVFLVMSLFWAVRYNGFFGFIKHVFGVKVKTNKWVFPIISLLFLFIGVMEAVSIFFARPVALAMRLYGNVFAGETMLDMGLHIKSWLGSLAITTVVYFYETFVCGVQAFVFALLVVAFVGTMCSHAEEEPGH
jgi:F-type H+-transporting ATPase subunit a